jgi:hypothetical protein
MASSVAGYYLKLIDQPHGLSSEELNWILTVSQIVHWSSSHSSALPDPSL